MRNSYKVIEIDVNVIFERLYSFFFVFFFFFCIDFNFLTGLNRPTRVLLLSHLFLLRNFNSGRKKEFVTT